MEYDEQYKYVILHTIGRGAHGQAYLCRRIPCSTKSQQHTDNNPCSPQHTSISGVIDDHSLFFPLFSANQSFSDLMMVGSKYDMTGGKGLKGRVGTVKGLDLKDLSSPTQYPPPNSSLLEYIFTTSIIDLPTMTSLHVSTPPSSPSSPSSLSSSPSALSVVPWHQFLYDIEFSIYPELLKEVQAVKQNTIDKEHVEENDATIVTANDPISTTTTTTTIDSKNTPQDTCPTKILEFFQQVAKFYSLQSELVVVKVIYLPKKLPLSREREEEYSAPREELIHKQEKEKEEERGRETESELESESANANILKGLLSEVKALRRCGLSFHTGIIEYHTSFFLYDFPRQKQENLPVKMDRRSGNESQRLSKSTLALYKKLFHLYSTKHRGLTMKGADHLLKCLKALKYKQKLTNSKKKLFKEVKSVKATQSTKEVKGVKSITSLAIVMAFCDQGDVTTMIAKRQQKRFRIKKSQQDWISTQEKWFEREKSLLKKKMKKNVKARKGEKGEKMEEKQKGADDDNNDDNDDDEGITSLENLTDIYQQRLQSFTHPELWFHPREEKDKTTPTSSSSSSSTSTITNPLMPCYYIPEATLWNLFTEILLGVARFHSFHIIHRDLKSSNIFVKTKKSKDMVSGIGTKDIITPLASTTPMQNLVDEEQYEFFIGDFGVARILLSEDEFAKTRIGTPYYLAPEILQAKKYNSKADIWSLGVIFYEMTSLRRPFTGQSFHGLMYRILCGRYRDVPTYYSSE